MPRSSPLSPGAKTPSTASAEPAADELLIDGQEEVFSRTEVESGRIEHQAGAGSASDETGVEPVETGRQRP